MKISEINIKDSTYIKYYNEIKETVLNWRTLKDKNLDPRFLSSAPEALYLGAERIYGHMFYEKNEEIIDCKPEEVIKDYNSLYNIIEKLKLDYANDPEAGHCPDLLEHSISELLKWTGVEKLLIQNDTTISISPGGVNMAHIIFRALYDIIDTAIIDKKDENLRTSEVYLHRIDEI